MINTIAPAMITYRLLPKMKERGFGRIINPKSAIPGMCVGAFLDDGKSGRLLPAQAFTGMTIEEAVASVK